MRKRIITPVQQETALPDLEWLNIEELVEVEITSEDAAHPIESALLPGHASGWRAAGPGNQTIRLLFTNPQQLRRIWLNHVELPAVTVLELSIIPEISGGNALASLAQLRLA
ncbi:MAG: carbohydrate-binding protein [Deltaproteobacteria bacterium]|nr:carbohydrate-binding protein [Deltaproteobacteria bacterium]